MLIGVWGTFVHLVVKLTSPKLLPPTPQHMACCAFSNSMSIGLSTSAMAIKNAGLQARSTSDVTLLVISKFDYEELVHNYPEQNDIIVTNVLSLFGLDKDGNDSSVSKDAAEDTISEDAKEKLRCAFPC